MMFHFKGVCYKFFNNLQFTIRWFWRLFDVNKEITTGMLLKSIHWTLNKFQDKQIDEDEFSNKFF